MPPFGTTTLGNWIRDASTREAAIVMASAVGMTAGPRGKREHRFEVATPDLRIGGTDPRGLDSDAHLFSLDTD